MTLRAEIEATLLRVYFAPRKEGLAKEQTEAVIAVLSQATPKQIKELLK